MLIIKCCLCGSVTGEKDENNDRVQYTHTYCDACLGELVHKKQKKALEKKGQNYEPK